MTQEGTRIKNEIEKWEVGDQFGRNHRLHKGM